MGIKEIAFHINGSMFLYSIGAFILAVKAAIAQSLYLTMKRNIIDNMKTEKVTKNTSYKHPVIGGIGAAFVMFPLLDYLLPIRYMMDAYLMLWAMTTFLGLFDVFARDHARRGSMSNQF